jgi:hypothetical protein
MAFLYELSGVWRRWKLQYCNRVWHCIIAVVVCNALDDIFMDMLGLVCLASEISNTMHWLYLVGCTISAVCVCVHWAGSQLRCTQILDHCSCWSSNLRAAAACMGYNEVLAGRLPCLARDICWNLLMNLLSLLSFQCSFLFFYATLHPPTLLFQYV